MYRKQSRSARFHPGMLSCSLPRSRYPHAGLLECSCKFVERLSFVPLVRFLLVLEDGVSGVSLTLPHAAAACAALDYSVVWRFGLKKCTIIVRHKLNTVIFLGFAQNLVFFSVSFLFLAILLILLLLQLARENTHTAWAGMFWQFVVVLVFAGFPWQRFVVHGRYWSSLLFGCRVYSNIATDNVGA